METITTEPVADFIVVGSGAGGGPLACNLAKAGYTVLVLEAGKDCSANINTCVPTYHALASEDDELKWDFFVKHYSNPERQREDSKFVPERDGILYPRAGTLGGCTVHNAMIFVAPHNSDWDAIAELTGDRSWHSDTMRGYFERIERCRYGVANTARRILSTALGWIGIGYNPTRRGYGGWLTISEANPFLLLQDKKLLSIVVEAVKSAFEHRRGGFFRKILAAIGRVKSDFDPNDWEGIRKRSEGVAFTPIATLRGCRTSTREYLKAVQAQLPDRLKIRTDALASRILFDDEDRAIGVEFIDGENIYRAGAAPAAEAGTLRQVYARREVIIAGGAFNSPQLLQLSGIGPKEDLERLGIPVRVDLPGVGRNLQDRYEVGVVSRMKGDFGLLQGATFSDSPDDPHFLQWRKSGSGLYTSNGAVIGIVRRSKANRPDPDLYIFGLVGYFKGYVPGYATSHIKNRNYYTWAVLKGHTNNRAGRVMIRSNDPRDTPDINFAYFDDDAAVSRKAWEDDLDAVVEGVEFVRMLNRDSDLSSVIDTEEVPGPAVTNRDALRAFIKREAWGHHASCTCRIGRADDPMAVLDSRFRVYGTKGLRVVDASVFPRIPGLFIVSAVYMISEKASDVIIEDAKKDERLVRRAPHAAAKVAGN